MVTSLITVFASETLVSLLISAATEINLLRMFNVLFIFPSSPQRQTMHTTGIWSLTPKITAAWWKSGTAGRLNSARCHHIHLLSEISMQLELYFSCAQRLPDSKWGFLLLGWFVCFLSVSWLWAFMSLRWRWMARGPMEKVTSMWRSNQVSVKKKITYNIFSSLAVLHVFPFYPLFWLRM